MSNTITKPWGTETILTEKELPYTLKIIKILQHHQLSLQYHDKKTETLVLVSGQVKIVFGQKITSLITQEMKPEIGYTITPGTIHRFIAETDATLIEASTKEEGTTHRLQDDYNRSDETDQVRLQPNRGWSNS